MFRTVAITLALWLTSPLIACADGTAKAPVTPMTLWQAWNWDSLILFNLCVLAVLYLVGVRRLWRRAGAARSVGHGQVAAYLISLGILFVALISPLHALSEELAAAHMVQHMLLIVVAAPLFVFGSPGHVLLWGLEPNWRPLVARWSRSINIASLDQPLLPWALHAAALWLWHWPPAYQAALVDPLVHDAQHLSFFAAACLYWRPLLNPLRARRLHPLAAVASLFATSLQAMLLGIFLSLSPGVWYDAYSQRTAAWGFAPLEDQQLAGLIMWMPACLVYPALAAVTLFHWLATQSNLQPRQLPLQEG
jgi:putative membrane protein